MASRRLVVVALGYLLSIINLAAAQRVANIFVLRGGKHYAFRGVYATFGPSGMILFVIAPLVRMHVILLPAYMWLLEPLFCVGSIAKHSFTRAAINV